MQRPLSLLVALGLGALAGRSIHTARADCACSPITAFLHPIEVPEPVCEDDADCEAGFRSSGTLNQQGAQITLHVYPADMPYALESAP